MKWITGWLVVSGVCGLTFTASACEVDSVGVSVALSDTSQMAFACRGFGQEFVATDTLIESISTWRGPQPIADAQPRHLFITGTSETGVPDITNLVFSGTQLAMPPSDGVHPVEYRFVFDPPFPLPHAGKYFLVIMAETYAAFPVLAVKGDPYPYGRAWRTGPVYYCDRPGYPFTEDPQSDMAFEVRFCKSDVVPIMRRSWGSLKSIYR